MSDASRIEWTNATWNVVTGCTRVSEGCDRCYIKRTPPFRIAGRRFDTPGIGGTTGVQLHPDRLAWPLRWRKPRRVFVNSLADLFHDEVPLEFIARLWVVMAACQQHTFQILTKRAARMRSVLTSPEFQLAAGRAAFDFMQEHQWVLGWSWPLPNVHLGVSTETQRWADIRIPLLLDTPAAVRWISAEPLLGPIDVDQWLCSTCKRSGWVEDEGWEPEFRGDHRDGPGRGFVPCSLCNLGGWHREFTGPSPGLDWVVVGGESGPGARPMEPDWARSLRDQCATNGVPFHFKQWGGWVPNGFGAGTFTDPDILVGPEVRHEGFPHRQIMTRVSKKTAGRELDGRTHDEFPEVARGRTS